MRTDNKPTEQIQQTFSRWYLEGITRAQKEGLREGIIVGSLLGLAVGLLTHCIF